MFFEKNIIGGWCIYIASTVLASVHMKNFSKFIFTTTLQDRKSNYSHFTYRQLKHTETKQHAKLWKNVEVNLSSE